MSMGMDGFSLVKRGVKLSDHIVGATGVELLPSGAGEFRGPCPIHQSSNKSTFVVNDETGYWKCYSGDCGSGSVIDFHVAMNPHLSPDDPADLGQALAELAQMYDITLPQTSSSRQKFSRSLLQEVFTEFAHWCHELLMEPEDVPDEVNDYLDDRGIPDWWIEEFSVGFAPSHQECVDFAEDLCSGRGGLSLAVAAGVLRESGHDSSSYFCPYANRLTIPLGNRQGSGFVGISARLVPHLKPGMGSESKYINTHATTLYDKSAVMYNHHVLYDKSVETVVVCEGSFDVMALTHEFSKSGARFAAVASSGTSLTQGHMECLINSGKDVVFTFDNDDGGTKGFSHAAQLSASIPHSSRQTQALILPPNSDPADLALAGLLHDTLTERLYEVDELPQLVPTAAELLAVKYSSADDPQGFKSAVRPLMRSLRKVAEVNAVISIVKSRFGLTDEGARSLVTSVGQQSNRRGDSTTEYSDHRGIAHSLLSLAVAHPEVFLPLMAYGTDLVTSSNTVLSSLSNGDQAPELGMALASLLTHGNQGRSDDLTERRKVEKISAEAVFSQVSLKSVSSHLITSVLPRLIDESGSIVTVKREIGHHAVRSHRHGDFGASVSAVLELICPD